jgi:hypothetical protein
MALNAAFILPPLQQCIFDKTLDTFLAGGKVIFYEDANRTIYKNVYTLSGTGPGNYSYVSLGYELTLSGIGSFVDEEGGNIPIYLWPFTGSPNDMPPSETIQNYYIEVYSSTGVFQFDIPNWPGVTANESPINTAETTDNIISNPQFVDVNFSTLATMSSPAVFTTSGTQISTEIAPDWFVVTTGSGTFSVYQQVVTESTPDIGNPPYALGISSSGYSEPIILRQRIFSPRIFSQQFVSGTFVGQSISGGVITLSMNYTPSITGTPQLICTGTLPDSGFATIANSTAVLITNPGGGTGYVDITIVIPVGVSVQITSVQLCEVASIDEQVLFLEQTPERQIDHLFHYFQPQLNFKPISSYLIGWDFPLNPAQFGRALGSQAIGANTSYYVWDQTILFQTVTNSLTVGAGANLTITAAANTQFAVIQYLSLAQMTAIMLQLSVGQVSSNVRLSTTANQTYTISLWYTNSGTLPSISSNLSLVTGLDSNGHPNSVASGWTEITRFNQQYATFTTSSAGGAQDFGFNGWNNPTAFSTAMNFAIVVGSGPVTSGNSTNFLSISLVPGAIPTIPAPQSADDVLRQCQYYYEKSYPPGYFGGSSIGLGSVIAFQNSELFTATNVAAYFYQDVISLMYKQTKRVTNGAITIFSVGGTINKLTAYLNGIDSGATSAMGSGEFVVATYWTATNQSDSYVYFVPVTANLGVDLLTITPQSTQHFIGTTAWVAFQYTIDARLGVV